MGRRVSCLLVCLLVLSLTVESHSFFIRRQVGNNAGECRMNRSLHNVGYEITIPGASVCWKLRCHNEGWFMYEAGCSDIENDVCNPVGTTYVYNCTRYTCTESSQDGNITYRSIVVSRQCRDYNGWCLNSGSQISVRFDDGVVHHNCSCTVRYSVVNYFCSV